jgi:hypothetical protein
MMTHRIDSFGAPLFVSWQLTRDCDLACVHCCTDSAPGKRLPDELDADEAMVVADDIARSGVPYVMLCGGEPLVVPHFFAVAAALGHAGIKLKIETNGQQLDAVARGSPTADPPIQASRWHTLGSLWTEAPGISRRHNAPRDTRRRTSARDHVRAHAPQHSRAEASSPAPGNWAPSSTRQADALGNCRPPLEQSSPSERSIVNPQGCARGGRLEPLELCYVPWSVEDGIRAALVEPPATLLVLPNGWVKVAAALPNVCADLRRMSIVQAWQAYREAWRNEATRAALRRAIDDESSHAQANELQWVPVVHV